MSNDQIEGTSSAYAYPLLTKSLLWRASHRSNFANRWHTQPKRA